MSADKDFSAVVQFDLKVVALVYPIQPDIDCHGIPHFVKPIPVKISELGPTYQWLSPCCAATGTEGASLTCHQAGLGGGPNPGSRLTPSAMTNDAAR